MRLQPGQSARGGHADGTAPLPVYPAEWIERPPDQTTVDALLVIDPQGTASVRDITATADNCADACLEAFRAAVSAALQQWRFLPLEVLDWIDGVDEDGDGEPDSVERGVVDALPYSLRLRFAFERNQGAPQVGMATRP